MDSNDFFSANNHLSENGIAVYVDAMKLDRIKELPTTIVHHVETCEECKMQIMEVAELFAGEQYDKTMKHPFFDAKETVSSPYSIIYRIAALFIIAVFAGTIYYFLSNRSPDTIQNKPSLTREEQIHTPAPIDSLPAEQKQSSKKPPENMIAANFEPSENFEDLVQMQFRSTTIEVISPEIGEIVENPITFRWKHYDKPITIKILSNKELTLVSTTVTADSFTTTKKFAPGLYYWKLETENELLFVGKFLVK